MLTPAEELAQAKTRIRGYNDALCRITRMFGADHQTAVGIRNCIAEVAGEMVRWQAEVDREQLERESGRTVTPFATRTRELAIHARFTTERIRMEHAAPDRQVSVDHSNPRLG